MYSYVLFDLDGTLTDPKQGICGCVKYALAAEGIVVDNLDVLEPFIGPPLKDCFIEFYHMGQEQADRAVMKYRERFERLGLYENEIYPGVREMLCALKGEGKKLVIASSKPTVFVKKILEHFKISVFFDYVIGSGLDGSRSRKEEVIEEALKSLSEEDMKNYEECVMVGDRKFDIEGARICGLHSVGVSYGYGGRKELEAAGAEHIVDTVGELADFLNNRI